MDKPASPEKPIRRAVKLDHHDSVRSHVRERISSEVEHLERRIASLRLSRAPHADILISTYERLLDRKKGFLQSWNLKDGGPR
ncbi:hypothetical protein [Marinobacter pelagius]|uniref:Uncharacterized protein n=1 Tax=Marinobacter pelagius TaxID=379482 RepID=A0A1I4RTM4_9GAMM|nr:hypothetical protein [Marinobacter pelagius]SFM55568.1 hypothetical protein SAMN04487961_0679 [Marinobacter pelagius]